MSIITVTLSPAIDVHCHLPELVPEKEHLAMVSSRDFGGKGVNISRVLTANGVENTAFVVMGKESEKEFSEGLSKEGITHRGFLVEGRIRENITLHTDDGKETRISFASPAKINDGLWRKIESDLLASVTEGSVVTLTGRVPEGISIASVKDTLLRLKSLSIKTVIDSKSFSLDDLIACKPWLIKPNEEEIEQYVGKRVTSLSDAITAAKRLYSDGIENVMISLGAQGAVLVCDSGCYCATPPTVQVKSTVGAGDSTIAGFLTGIARGMSPNQGLAFAVSCGTASCMTDGTAAPLEENIATIFEKTTIKRI